MQAKSARKKVRSLRIIIVGCGKVGHTLTEQLVREGHDITIVDTSERVVRDTTEMFDVMGIRGNGASLNVLMEAGLQEADLVIAVTGSDELNLLCCTIARKAGGELAAIARVRNPDYSEELPSVRQQLGLSMIINPGAGGRAGNRASAFPSAGADGQLVCQGARRAGAFQDSKRKHPARASRHAAG